MFLNRVMNFLPKSIVSLRVYSLLLADYLAIFYVSRVTQISSAAMYLDLPHYNSTIV